MDVKSESAVFVGEYRLTNIKTYIDVDENKEVRHTDFNWAFFLKRNLLQVIIKTLTCIEGEDEGKKRIDILTEDFDTGSKMKISIMID